MDKDIFDHVTEYMAKEESECADDLIYALELVKSCFESTKEKIKKSIHESVDSNDFETLQMRWQYNQEIDQIITDIDDRISALMGHSENISIERVTTSDELSSSEGITESGDTTHVHSYIDYGKYATNRFEKHSLYEDFEHKRPCAFQFNGSLIEEESWQGILVQICRILAEMDLQKMRSFTTDPGMQGRKLKYFSYESTPGKNKRIPGTDVYVWINNSANTIVKFIRKLLKEYGISPNEVEIFLRADYTPLHE